MQGYIDVHCHLTGEEFDSVGGVGGVLARAKSCGVERVVCSGFDLSSSYRAMEIAEQFDEAYFCVGYHPSELKGYREGDLDELKRLCRHEKCVAIGEIGLDYHFEDNPPKAQQRALFLRQLQLAYDEGLPVVLHSRDAAGETLELLRENEKLLANGGLLHCYSYSAEMVESFAALGLHFSFGGACTFKNAKKVWESVQRVPACRILSETDCPYMTPVPFRGEFPNQPCHVTHAVDRMAGLRGVTVEDLAAQMRTNATTLFKKLKF